MKWYAEEETKKLREVFEKEILKWPQVDYKKMFGCPGYLVNGKMFAGLVTKGIVITRLNNLEKEELKKIREIKPFVTGDRIVRSWVHIGLEPEELEQVMPFVKKSYQHTLKKSRN